MVSKNGTATVCELLARPTRDATAGREREQLPYPFRQIGWLLFGLPPHLAEYLERISSPRKPNRLDALEAFAVRRMKERICRDALQELAELPADVSCNPVVSLACAAAIAQDHCIDLDDLAAAAATHAGKSAADSQRERN
jgi:hypothetical protein